MRVFIPFLSLNVSFVKDVKEAQRMKNAFISWRDDLSVGVSALDDQHKQVLDVINSIYEIRFENASHEALLKNLTKLQFFTETHFRYEESVMKFANYPNFEEHRLYHEAMMAKTVKICSQFRSNIQSDTDDLFQLLKNWWLSHICKEDRDYIECVKQLGL
jgi:hemerythrin